ncbi:MAG: endonuclease domain-containing protein [Balneolaceae bacterium]|nr:endonuclease domain-containing protein [Balneolaceae bacterium]
MNSRRKIIELARELRKNSTKAEKLLWAELRNRRLNGVKFLRQHPLIYENDRGKLYFFIPDFYSSEYKLVIELDGKIHKFQKDYDKDRDLVISKMGLKVVRFKNEETHNMQHLLRKISSHF